MLPLLFLLLSTLANSDGEGTNNYLVLKRTKRDVESYRLFRGPCDENWFYIPLLNSCYQYFDDLRTMQDAEEFCNNHPHSGHLASVSSSIHNNFIFNVIRAVDENETKAWIGLNDRSQEGYFTWSDGTSYIYREWAAGEPNNDRGNEDCVDIDYKSGTPYWNDLPCDMNLGPVRVYKLHCV